MTAPIARPRPRPRAVAVLLFDDVEVLDFAAPFEVFSVAGRRGGGDPFDVFTVSAGAPTVRARNGLCVTAHHTLADCPAADVLVVPGGFGSRVQMRRPETLDWVRRMAASSEVVLSVCTGALILAGAHLLRGRRATTHASARTLLQELEPTCEIASERVVDTGDIVCTAGVSAGLDGSLHLVARFAGEEIARECASYIEYDWRVPTGVVARPHSESPSPA